ncbi:hypothetical protein [Frateuria defendens]|uniref:hypothetical protein n=1 Tax=Frateuria defendens TaxID=2219559 RepID=UPI00066FEA1C|nr:hypothetical protein [Frateuria defendens]
MRLQAFRTALLSLLVLATAACHDKEQPAVTATPGGDTPEAAVMQSVALIKAGDFNGFWKHALPPADYATLRADWTLPRPGQPPISNEDRARFATTMQQLTAPDAETRLYGQLQPQLAQAEQKYKDQLPMLIGLGQSVLKSGVAQNQTLSAEQKQQANAVIDVLAPWAQQVPWFDPAKAKQAVGVVAATARKLDLKSPDQLRTMDFDNAMQRYATAFAGAKDLLAIYGLSVDQALDSVKATPIDNAKGRARVRLDYTLLGKPLSTETVLVQQDGRWYGEDLLNNARESHARLTAPAAGASTAAPASSAAAPATAASATAAAH